MIKFAEGFNPDYWPQEPGMQLRAHCLKRDDMRRNLVEARKAMDVFLDATAIEWETNEAYREQDWLDATAHIDESRQKNMLNTGIEPWPGTYWGNADKKERRRKRLAEQHRHRKREP